MVYDSYRYSHSSEWLRIEITSSPVKFRKCLLQPLFGVAED